jgi:hypothetical protein
MQICLVAHIISAFVVANLSVSPPTYVDSAKTNIGLQQTAADTVVDKYDTDDGRISALSPRALDSLYFQTIYINKAKTEQKKNVNRRRLERY